MKTPPLFLLSLLLSSMCIVQAQSGVISIKSAAERIDKVLDKKTNQLLSDEQIHDLVRKHPNIIFDYEITKYGTKENLSIHSDSIRTGAFDRMGKYPALKQGEKVHEFVFKTLNGETFSSENLQGKYIIIRFDLVPTGRFFNQKHLIELDHQIGELANTEQVQAFVCFMERDESQFDELQLTSLNIVPDCSLFLEKFGIPTTPTTLLFDTEGKLIGSYSGSGTIDLKSVIK